MSLFDTMPEVAVEYELTVGDMLKEEFMDNAGVTTYALSKATGVQQTAIAKIIRNEKRITPEIALLFAKFFGNDAMFWLRLQNEVDLKKAKEKLGERLEAVAHY